MIRAPLGNKVYWDKRVEKFRATLNEDNETLDRPAQNPAYGPQFWFQHCNYSFRLLALCYSRGDSISTLSASFPDLLDAWERSNKLAEELAAQLQSGEGWDPRRIGTAAQASLDSRSYKDPRSWIFELKNLNHYNWCFWLVSLALSLEISDSQWQRLIALIGAEGQDVLIDRVIAFRQPERVIGKELLHKKPYARLLRAIDAPKPQQAGLLLEFVQHWYTELSRKGAEELWWYTYGDPIKHPLEMGSYFGRWCFEAVAAVKVFGLDDSLCIVHEHYPGDLLRADGSSIHPLRGQPRRGLLERLFRKKNR